MKRFNKAKVFAATAAVFSGATFLANFAQANNSVSWAASGTGVLNLNTNWAGNVLPAGADDVFFGASSQNALTLTAGVTYFTMTFNSDAPAYTVGAVGTTQTITLGANGSPPTGGNITNNSANVLTFNTPMAIRRGTINASGADIVFTNTFNVGNNGTGSTTIGRNIDVTGSHNVTFAGQLLGTATVTANTPEIPDDDIANVDNGRLIKDGSGTLFLTNNGNNTNFTGPITINSGAVQANVANAFGANGTITNGTRTVTLGATHVSGGTNTGRVELIGGTSFAPETLVLEGRSVTDTQLLNVGGNNTWTGPVNVTTGGGSYAIQSDSGLLTVAGNITNITATNGIRTLALRGASNGIVSGNIVEGTGAATSTNLSPFKDGTGTWTFSGTNTYSGVTTVSAGVLQIGAGTTSGNLGTGSVAVAGGTLAFNHSDAIVVTNPISGAGTVRIAGNAVTLSTGNVSGVGLSVADGAALTLSSTSPTTTMSIGNFSAGDTVGSTINFGLGIAGNPSVPLINATGLTRNGANTVNILGSNFSVGTITLINYAGTAGGSGALSLGAIPNRMLAALIDTGSEIDLHVTGIDFPKWTGALNNNWDTSVNGNPKDWVLNSNGTTPTDYIEGDSVLFDDSSSINTVNINNTVLPNAVTVNNSSKDYTFSGSGGISGPAVLVKTGTHTLTIANSGVNDFTGAISIGAGGTLSVGNGGTSGSLGSGTITNNGNLVLNRVDGATLGNVIAGPGAIQVNANSAATLSGSNTFDGTVTVQAGATLAVNSATALGSTVGGTTVQSGAALIVGAGGSILFAAEPLTISGTGTAGSPGAIHATGTMTSNFFGPVSLAGDTTLFAEPGATGALSGTISGAGLDIKMDGGGTWILSGAGNGYRNTTINSGTLSMGGGGTSGSIGTGTLLVNSGGTFSINRSDLVSFGTVIDGAGALAKDGSGTVALTTNNTFTGPVILTRGVLRADSNNAFGVGVKNIVIDSRTKGIEVDGGIILPNSISFTTLNDGTGTPAIPSIHSVAGTNTINGNITMITTVGVGTNTLVSTDAGGTLILNSNVTGQPGQGAHSFQIGGSGTTILNGVLSDPSPIESNGLAVAGTGGPTLIVNNANTMTANVSINSGTLVVNNNQALGFTSSSGSISVLGIPGTFCFVGSGASAAFANIPGALVIGTDGITVPNNLWTNRDGAGTTQSPTAETFERVIGFGAPSGTGTFSGNLLINGGAVFQSTANGTLIMSGVLQDGTEAIATGGRKDVFVTSLGTIVFSGNNTYSGYTQVNSGTLVLASSGAQNLIINGPATTTNPYNATGPFGADLRGGRLVFDYAAAGVSDPLPTIRPLLQTSLTTNFATGQFRVGNATPGTGIGYTDDGVGRLQLVRTYLGDANLDGKVNMLDFNALATDFGASSNQQWVQGDFNYDGSVGMPDFVLLAQNFNQALPAAPAPVLGALVPEPSLLVCLLVGALMLRRRRARQFVGAC